jgi:hypothetical protein
MIWRRGLHVLAMLAAPLAQAQEAPPPWEGVWRGTIGAYPVVACLARDGLGEGRGAYYYLSKRSILRLQAGTGEGRWQEDAAEHKSAPVWKLNAPSGSALAGTWSDGAGRDLPVAMTRVAYVHDEGACGSRAFMAPRLGPVKIVRKAAVKGGLAYEALNYDVGSQFETVAIDGFALVQKMPGDAAINRAVALDPLKPENEADFATCLSGGIRSLGMDGDFSISAAPAPVPGDFLAVTTQIGYYCGGPHPDAFTRDRAFDRRSGAEIALWRWIAPPALRAGTGPTRELAAKLRALVLRRYPSGDAECRNPVRDNAYWGAALTASGLSYTPQLPHVVAACAETAKLSWRALAPFLSAEGKAGLRRIINGK